MTAVDPTLAGKTRPELEAELAALLEHRTKRREDVFPADAEEEASFAENVARYEAALEAV